MPTQKSSKRKAALKRQIKSLESLMNTIRKKHEKAVNEYIENFDDDYRKRNDAEKKKAADLKKLLRQVNKEFAGKWIQSLSMYYHIKKVVKLDQGDPAIDKEVMMFTCQVDVSIDSYWQVPRLEYLKTGWAVDLMLYNVPGVNPGDGRKCVVVDKNVVAELAGHTHTFVLKVMEAIENS